MLGYTIKAMTIGQFKWLPNALSVSRALLAFPIALLALNQQWVLAFWILAIAALTDFFDGIAATAFRVESQLGKDWIDPLSDAIMTIGAVSGLIFQTESIDKIWKWGLSLLPIIIAAAVLKVLKHQAYYPTLHRIATVVLPLGYLAILIIVINIYAWRAFDLGILGIVISIPTIIFAGIIKKHRFVAWLAGKR